MTTREEALPKDIVAVRALSVEPEVTRWQPVDFLCEGDVHVRAKLVRVGSPDTAAVAVSETVGHAVLAAIGFVVAEPHAVTLTQAFADDVTAQYGFSPPVSAGRHWGTTLLTDRAMAVEFSRYDMAALRDRVQMVTLFIADVLLANRDRTTYGNVLLYRGASTGGLDIVPIDQSDYFNHPPVLRSPAELERCRDTQIGIWLPGTEVVVMEMGATVVRTEIDRVRSLRAPILDAVGEVPDEWYARAGADPSVLRDFLAYRLDHLDTLVNYAYWDGLAGATGGGHVIEF